MIAAKQLRSGMVRIRPPHQGRGGGGSRGSTIAHSSSETRVSTRVVIARNRGIDSQGSETTSKHLEGHHADQSPNGTQEPRYATDWSYGSQSGDHHSAGRYYRDRATPSARSVRASVRQA